MNITLRPYQETAISKLKHTGQNVLSICPGGGKTFTAIEYINRSSFRRVLILAHGTNVLKNQWKEELKKLNIAHSTNLNDKCRIVVALPHSLSSAEKLDFDLVICDEAHEFFYAPMVQKALQRIKPDCVLLLTGTPSKFIKNKISPVIISGCEVYNQPGNYLANAYFGMVKSTYQLNLENYSDDGEVLADYELTDEQTNSSLENLVTDMLKRLQAPDFVKNNPSLGSAMDYSGLSKIQQAFATLEKTLIACKSIQQAQALSKQLSKHKVNLLVSESESDVDSLNVQRFMNEKDVQVLIVVRRGILGFNFPELVNVVDFTMSRNIDRIYQLYARVLRTSPKAPNKFFFRLCSALNPAIDAYYMQAAMCMNSPEFISKYNGKNLKQLPIIVPKKKVGSNKKRTGSGKSKARNVSIDEDMLDVVLSLELLTELTVKSKSKHWNEHAYMKFGQVVSDILNINFVDINPDEKKMQIKEFFNKHGRLPSQYVSDTVEKKLAMSLHRYCSPSQNCFDPEFRAWKESIQPSNTVELSKAAIKEFFNTHGRLPSRYASDPVEKKLGGALRRYCSPADNSFDSEFKAWKESLQPSSTAELKKEAIKEFFNTNKRLPSQTASDPVEKKLAMSLHSYCSPKSKVLDPDFKAWRDKMKKRK